MIKIEFYTFLRVCGIGDVTKFVEGSLLLRQMIGKNYVSEVVIGEFKLAVIDRGLKLSPLVLQLGEGYFEHVHFSK